MLIEGRLKLDTWEKDGKKKSKLRVVGERMQMLGGRGPVAAAGADRLAAARSGQKSAGPPPEMEYSPAEANPFDGGSEPPTRICLSRFVIYFDNVQIQL